MKISTSLAFISLSISFSLISMQAVSAQETRGARFSFAPNVWKNESSRIPKDAGDMPHNVKNGSVPQSSNFLGVDPQMLAKPPAPPVVQQQVAAKPIINTVIPAVSAPKATFNPAFGQPQVASLSPVATPNIQPQRINAKRMTPIASKPILPASKSVHSRSTANVNGKLLKRRSTPLIARQATPAVANYGKNFGYMPGPYLPTTSSSGANAQAEVRGRLLK